MLLQPPEPESGIFVAHVHASMSLQGDWMPRVKPRHGSFCEAFTMLSGISISNTSRTGRRCARRDFGGENS